MSQQLRRSFVLAVFHHCYHVVKVGFYETTYTRKLFKWSKAGVVLLKNRMATETMKDCEPPLFTFGIIADIQYADIDDGFNFKQTRKRYYRNSLRLLQKANEGWNVEQVKPSFILQLGDIIDGFNKKFDASQCALDRVMREFNHSPAVHHVWGNHEFYNFTRGVLFSSVLNTKSNQDRVSDPDEFYAYHFSPTPNFRFVVLDAYDLSVIGREQASEKYKQSLKLLKEHNNKEDLNHPPGN